MFWVTSLYVLEDSDRILHCLATWPAVPKSQRSKLLTQIIKLILPWEDTGSHHPGRENYFWILWGEGRGQLQKIEEVVIRLSQLLQSLTEAKVNFLSLNYTLNVIFLFLHYFISTDLVKINIVSRDENNLLRDFDYIILFKPNNLAR